MTAQAISNDKNNQPLIRHLQRYDDLLTLYQHNPERYPYLLESVAYGTPQAQYDILFCFPKEQLVLNADEQLSFDNTCLEEKDFLKAFDRAWQAKSTLLNEEVDLPFMGGWFLYLAYELAAQVEPTLSSYRDHRLPVAFATRIGTAVIRDHENQSLIIVSDKLENLEQVFKDLDEAQAINSTPLHFDKILEEDPQHYINGIDRIKDYIVEGDIFQVNLSRIWQARSEHTFSPVSLYEHLRRSNPAPFSGLASYGNQTIISSSPERLVSTHAGKVETRPIAGTRPRSEKTDQDTQLAKELLKNEKERAEHIMLIDLERNDLGRVCQPGSIEVNELMVRETYSHVHHIVSNVRGVLRDNIAPGEVIRAIFPGGTITGCPKVRCMEIIHELENSARGAYTGSMGYINDNGDLDLNILIRSLVTDGKTVDFRAGGGIVADSIPEREVDETRSKAKGLLEALQS